MGFPFSGTYFIYSHFDLIWFDFPLKITKQCKFKVQNIQSNYSDTNWKCLNGKNSFLLAKMLIQLHNWSTDAVLRWDINDKVIFIILKYEEQIEMQETRKKLMSLYPYPAQYIYSHLWPVIWLTSGMSGSTMRTYEAGWKVHNPRDRHQCMEKMVFPLHGLSFWSLDRSGRRNTHLLGWRNLQENRLDLL